MQQVRWLLVATYFALDLVMKAPAYYILARINIASGSTGYHRAALIEAALKHLDEWWLGGTDYTRHWMPTGVSWSPAHTDITNHYIQLGVLGGLPLMLIFIWILATGFSFVGRRVKKAGAQSSDEAVMVWCLGAALFAHVATMISVSYFDQSFLFVYLTLALIGSVSAGAVLPAAAAERQVGRIRRGDSTAGRPRRFLQPLRGTNGRSGGTSRKNV
jgi:hypothetical protein